VIGRTTVVILEILLASVIAGLVGVGVLAWRLTEGPIELDWARETIAGALSDSGSDLTATVGRTTLALSSWERAFDVVAEDVVLVDSEGAVGARIGAVSLALSPTALFHGRLAPTRLDVLNPVVTVVRGVDGRWTVKPSDPATGQAQETMAATDLLRPLLDAQDGEGPLGYLRSAQVRGATVRLVDDARGRTQALSAVSGGISRVSGGLTFQVTGRADWTGEAPTPISLAGDYRPASEDLRVEVRFDNLPPAALADLDPRLARLGDIDSALSGEAMADTRLDGSGFTAEASLSFAPGRFRLPEVTEDWLAIGGGSLKARVAPNLRSIVVDGSFEVDDVLLAATTRLAKDGSGYAVVLDAVASDLAVADIGRYWPPDVSDGAREWVTENLTAGQVTSATIRAEGWIDGLDPGIHEIDSVGGTINFEGVETHYFRPLPPVVGSSGMATFDATRFDIAIRDGQLDGMRLEPSTVTLTNLDKDVGETAAVEVVVRGPVRDALELLDRQPLGYASRVGLDASKTAGDFGARVRFTIPLLRTLKVEQIGIAASANLRGATVPDVLRGQSLSEAALALDLTGAGMSLSGTGRLGPVPVGLSYEQRFSAAGPFLSRTSLQAEPMAADLVPFGLDLTDYVDGPMALDATLVETADGGLSASVTGDLQKAKLTIADLDWEKPADAVGVARVDVSRSPAGVLAIPSFEIRAGTLFAEGAVDFPEAGGAIAALSRFRLERTDAAGRVEIGSDGAVTLEMNGPEIDLIPLGRQEAESDAPSLSLRVAADTLHVLEEMTLAEGRLYLTQSGPSLETLGLSGQIDGSPLRMTVQPADGRRLLTVATNEAGTFLKAFGIIDSIQGGRLRVDGELKGDGLDDALDLAVRLDEFRLVDAPAFARVLSSASLTGLVDTISGDGIRFARATGEIAITAEEIAAKNVVAYGPGLGLKVDGTLGRQDDSLEMDGLIAPAYSLSRLIDVVPVFGQLLTGGEGEGLLATAYSVRGTVGEPQIKVNPLTALAPGFLRDIIAAASRPGEGPATIRALPASGLDETLGR
jgi:hypothetical protein